MKNAGKARSYGLYRHLRTSKEIIENLLNYLMNNFSFCFFTFPASLYLLFLLYEIILARDIFLMNDIS